MSDRTQSDINAFYERLDVAPDQRSGVPDPVELWAMLQDTGLLGGDRLRWFSPLMQAQSRVFGDNGPLSDMPAGFRIAEHQLESALHEGSRCADWTAWCGRHVGRFCAHAGAPFDDTHTWYEPIRVNDAWEVQPVRFSDKPLGYNVTYFHDTDRQPCRTGIPAGYVAKGPVRAHGAHLGFGSRSGAYEWIAWLLPEEAFLEVRGPDPTTGDCWRTAFNHFGDWGRWRIDPLSEQAPRSQAL